MRVGVHVAVAGADHDLTLLGDLGVGVRDRLDLRLRQQLGDALAGALAEDRQRLCLGRDDRDRELHVHVVGPSGRHQRELVQRQRPGHAPRSDEGEARRRSRARRPGSARAASRPSCGRRSSSRACSARRCARPSASTSASYSSCCVAARCARRAARGRPSELVADQLGADVAERSARAGSGARRGRRTARARSSGGRRTPRWGRSRSSARGRPRARFSASAVSSAATPPPAISTRNFSGWVS